MRKIAVMLAGLAVAIFSLSGIAQSQSFDCKYAELPDEVVICRDSDLGKLDSEMVRLFLKQRALLKGPELQAFTKDQSTWLASRIACRNDAQCIRSKYEQRIAYLAAQTPQNSSATVFELPPDQVPIAIVKYDGRKASGLQYGDISLTVDSEPVAGGPERLPFVVGRYKGQTAFSIHLNGGPDSYGQEEPAATVSLMKIDPSTPAPQVMLTYFWGGAHCCTMTRIATVDASGHWRIVDAGALDGEGYEFKDLDGDGGSELVSVDNSFLYAFGCYACSFAPTQIHKLVGAALKDVTREVRYQSFLKYQIRQMEQAATKDEQWGSNGFLGGWVASKALVGELWDAWRTMLQRYEHQSDWNMDECLTGVELDKCPPDKLHKQNLPTALAKHLLSRGYITANEMQHLQVPSR